jgi:hypothetical protein
MGTDDPETKTVAVVGDGGAEVKMTDTTVGADPEAVLGAGHHRDAGTHNDINQTRTVEAGHIVWTGT